MIHWCSTTLTLERIVVQCARVIKPLVMSAAAKAAKSKKSAYEKKRGLRLRSATLRLSGEKSASGGEGADVMTAGLALFLKERGCLLFLYLCLSSLLSA